MPLGRACEFKQGNTTEIAASAMTTEVQPIADQPEDVTTDACFAQDDEAREGHPSREYRLLPPLQCVKLACGLMEAACRHHRPFNGEGLFAAPGRNHRVKIGHVGHVPSP